MALKSATNLKWLPRLDGELHPIAKQGAVFVFGLVALFWLYAATWLGMAQKYATSGTYAHGFLILPLSIWMIFQKKERFYGVPINYQVAALPVLVLLSLAWLMAGLAFVGIIQQLCFVLMLICLFVFCFGYKMALAFCFPLIYLLFAIPFGNFLTPSLQDLTASFAIKALEMTGIPVFYEGWQITTSSGEFEVAEACSGIRYLIATLALGALYAYVTFEKLWKRTVFCAICIIVPLVANGIRAYFIILIAHYSKMKYAVGVDHLIYGWLFFGFIIFILFSVGAYWRDPLPIKKASMPMILNHQSTQKHACMVLSMILCLALIPGTQHFVSGHNVLQSEQGLDWPRDTNSQWIGPLDNESAWKPKFNGPSYEQKRTYQYDQERIEAFVALYYNQTQDNELISENNHYFDKKSWILLGSSIQNIGKDKRNKVVELDIQNYSGKRLVWYVYVVAGVPTTNPVWGKILEGYSLVKFSKMPAGVIALSCEYEYFPSTARASLEKFIDQMGDQLLDSMFRT